MPNRVNTLLHQQYTDLFSEVNSFISIGYEGLTVQDTNALRGQVADMSCRMFFVRNRAVRRVFKDLERVDIAPLCEGQTAFVSGEDPVGLARYLVGFQKEHKELKFHGALVEDTILDGKGVVTLSKSPTKEELKGIISGQSLASGGKLGGALLGVGAMLASQIKKIAENDESNEESQEEEKAA